MQFSSRRCSIYWGRKRQHVRFGETETVLLCPGIRADSQPRTDTDPGRTERRRCGLGRCAVETPAASEMSARCLHRAVGIDRDLIAVA